MRLLKAALAVAIALAAGACSSRVERFDYSYDSTRPSFDRGYARLGGPHPAPPSGHTRIVTVTRGDTLSAIAQRHGVTAEALAQANALDGGRLAEGQTLIVPPARR